MLYLSTTIHGIEDIAAREIEALGGKIRSVMEGKIIYEGSDDLFYSLNYLAKKINRVVRVLGAGEIEGLEDIGRIVRASPVPPGSYSFGVSTERKGEHGFTSVDVNRLVGEIILGMNGNARVDLNDPDVPILAWVIGDYFIFGIDTTGMSLHRRGYRVAKHPAALNPVIAAAMLDIAGWNGKLVDPFCGSGTIPIEAYHQKMRVPNRFRDFQFTRLPFFDGELWKEIKSRHPRSGGREIRIMGLDKNAGYLEAARANAERAGAKVLLIRGDALELHRHVGDAPYIVTNPPYGLRMGSKKQVFTLYEKFAEELEEHFSGSTFVVITPHRKFEHYFDVIEKRSILYGELHAWIYKMKI